MSNIIALEELFASAQVAVKRNRVKNATPEEAKIEPARLYANPANWISVRTVAVLHRETETLLGYFELLQHRTVPSARRLVRMPEGPCKPTAIEYVSGDFNFELTGRVTPRPPRETARSIIISRATLVDSSLSVEFPEMTVFSREGHPFRADISIDCHFFSPEDDSFLLLPAGTDIYQQLDRESKIEIFRELNHA